ncbi:MAG: hypothetical protein ACRCZF_10095, partial [Gemmataceae bacterium]
RLVEIRWHDWYRGLIRQAAALETENPLELRWAGSFQQLLDSEKQTPTPTDGLIPGSVPLPIPRGTPLTYRVLADYDRITVARNDWHHARDRLLALSELAQALQGGPLDYTGVPRTPAERLQRFPPAEVQARWVVDRFSGAARQQLLARMVEQRERAITQALKHLPGPTLDELRQQATNSSELGPWSQSIQIFDQLLSNPRPEPLKELQDYLLTPQRTIELRSLEVSIPDDLRGGRAVATGALIVRQERSDASVQDYAYRPLGEARTDGPNTVQLYVAEGHPGRWSAEPGDRLSARLPFRAAGMDAELHWTAAGGGLYPAAPWWNGAPQCRAPNQTTGDRATGVTVQCLPEGGWPHRPVFIPAR